MLSSTFDGSESPLSESGDWTSGPSGWGDMNKTSGLAEAAATSTDALAYRNSAGLSSDQYSEIVTSWSSGQCYFGPCTRIQGTASGSTDCYNGAVWSPDSSSFISRVDDNSGTLSWNQLGAIFTIPTIASGDSVRLASRGSTHTLYKNGIAYYSRNDGTYTGGAPGFNLYENSTGTIGATSWEADSLTAAEITPGVKSTAAQGRDGNGTLTITLPTDWAIGQLALLLLYNDAGSGSTPSGWTQVSGSPWGGGTPKLQAWYRFLQSGDGNPTTTISGSASLNSHSGHIVTFNFVDTTTPIEAVGTASNGTGTPATAAAITTSTANAWALGLVGRGDNEAFSSQSFGGSTTGVLELTDLGSTAGNDSQTCIYRKIITSPGSTGNGSATTSSTDPWVSVLIALKPLATGITGDGAATFDNMTGSGTGTVLVDGDGAATLADMTGSGAGEILVDGDGAATFDDMTGTGTGTVGLPPITGDGAATFDDMTGSGAGEVLVDGDGAGTLADMTGSGAGEVLVDGDGAATFDDMTGAATGYVGFPPITGDGAATFDDMTGSGAGEVLVDGDGAGTLADMTGSGAGEVLVDGDGAATLADMTGEGTGYVGFPPITGDGAATFEDLLGSGAGQVLVRGDGSIVFELQLGSGAGEVLVDGSGAGTFDPMTGEGEGQVYTPVYYEPILPRLSTFPLRDLARYSSRKVSTVQDPDPILYSSRDRAGKTKRTATIYRGKQ